MYTTIDVSGYIQQLALPWSTYDVTNIAIRIREGGNWTSWQFFSNDALTTSNVAMRYYVTLPTSAYGNYYFSLYGLKDRHKYRVANAYIVGDSTDLASYISIEPYNDALVLALSASAPNTAAGKCLNIALAYA